MSNRTSRIAVDGAAVVLLLVIATAIAAWSTAGDSAYDVRARIVAGWETVNRQFGAGLVPLMNPLQFAGQPHFANPLTLAFYPPHAVLRLLPFSWFFSGTLAVHGWLAALGTYLVMRSLAAPRTAAMAAGVAVMLQVVFVHGPNLAYEAGALGAALAPLALAFAMRTTARDRAMPHPILVVVVTSALLGLSVRNVAYVAGAVLGWYGLVAIWPESSATRPRRLVAQLVILAALAVGLSAAVGLPAASLRRGAIDAGGLTIDRPLDDSWHDQRPRPLLPDRPIAAALEPLRGHRTIGACDAVADAGQLAALGIPVVGGYGGLLLSDYARFTNLASGLYPEKMWRYEGLPRMGHPPTRNDLVALLGAEYLIACDPPDTTDWTLLAQVGAGAVYRRAAPVHRAVWTCAPVAVGRQELEYRLTRDRYDATLSLREVGHMMNVRWVPDISDEVQRRTEAELHLERDRFMGDRTWRYLLLDTSPANASAVVTNPLVEDTAGLDRATFAVVTRRMTFDEPKTDWLIGGTPCPDTRPARVTLQDRADGLVRASVDAPRAGVVLFAETYYPQRIATVDGRRVTPLKADFAFTAVPVPAGTHQVELAYAPRSLLAGVVISLLTLLLWAAGEWR